MLLTLASSYPASYVWVFIDGKFVWKLAEYGDVLRSEEFRFVIPCKHGSTKQLKSAYCKLIWHGISVLHLLTLSGNFKLGFGVEHISNTIEH